MEDFVMIKAMYLVLQMQTRIKHLCFGLLESDKIILLSSFIHFEISKRNAILVCPKKKKKERKKKRGMHYLEILILHSYVQVLEMFFCLGARLSVKRTVVFLFMHLRAFLISKSSLFLSLSLGNPFLVAKFGQI